VFVSPEIPLVSLGDINLGKFNRSWHPESAKVYSWVLNNYWTTNFRAYQEGELTWTYILTSASDTTNGFATRFGWEERIPLLSRVFPGTGHTAEGSASTDIPSDIGKSLLGQSLQDLLMVCARPSADQKGIIIQLREMNGKQVSVPVNDKTFVPGDLLNSTHAKAAFETDVLEEVLHPVTGTLAFRPFETKFIRLEF
jgi:alpha-mannosidase